MVRKENAILSLTCTYTLITTERKDFLVRFLILSVAKLVQPECLVLEGSRKLLL